MGLKLHLLNGLLNLLLHVCSQKFMLQKKKKKPDRTNLLQLSLYTPDFETNSMHLCLPSEVTEEGWC